MDDLDPLAGMFSCICYMCLMMVRPYSYNIFIYIYIYIYYVFIGFCGAHEYHAVISIKHGNELLCGFSQPA